MTVRVLIADDHAVVRAGLAQLVAGFADIELVGAATDGEEAVAVCVEQQPDVALVDLEMPRLDGIEVTRRIKAARPETAIVILTVSEDEDDLFEAIKAGANYIVVGRPITRAADPRQAAEAIAAEIAGAS